MNLTVAANNPNAIPITVTVYVNGGTQTTLTCNVTSNGCTDTNIGHNWVVNAGDRVAIVVQNSGAVPAGTLSIHASLEKQ